jgi:hypothetical protein
MSYTLEIHRFDPTDPRLGRHVMHDSRSLEYLYLPKTAKPKKINTFWASQAGPLNQGDLGSCTGNASAQWLNTDFATPFREKVKKTAYLTEADAVHIYSLGTTLDSYPGSYPPDDTGCDGVSVAKACERLGYLSAYKHTMSFSSAQAAIEKSPAIQGSVWTNKMFKPKNGLVTVGKITDSTIAGGHEYEFSGIDWTEEVHIYRNSWGDQDAWPGCKPGGYFAIGFKDVQALLDNQGDVTVFIGK